MLIATHNVVGSTRDCAFEDAVVVLVGLNDAERDGSAYNLKLSFQSRANSIDFSLRSRKFSTENVFELIE